MSRVPPPPESDKERRVGSDNSWCSTHRQRCNTSLGRFQKPQKPNTSSSKMSPAVLPPSPPSHTIPTRTQTHTHTDTHRCTGAQTRRRTHIDTQTHAQTLTDTHTHTDMHTHTDTQTHTDTYTHRHAHRHAHRRTHRHTHTQTRTQTQRHTHPCTNTISLAKAEKQLKQFPSCTELLSLIAMKGTLSPHSLRVFSPLWVRTEALPQSVGSLKELIITYFSMLAVGKDFTPHNY